MRSLATAVALAVLTSVSLAQPGPDGYDFVTVGAPGNAAYSGPDPFNIVTGRGSVDYEFRIGRTEVTTSQWMEFFNAALARPDPLPYASLLLYETPVIWGATRDASYTGPGIRFKLRTDVGDAGMLPVGGVSWRTAAVLCNWLHNGKGSQASAFLSGAYDVSTFGYSEPFIFTDQAVRSPGARYWIPSLDEWMKAVHFDPNGDGGQGRWWEQPNGTDSPLIYGAPPSFGGDGSAQANAGPRIPDDGQYHIPLGSYPDTQSPWGLLDAAGATTEWLETIRVVNNRMSRAMDGSHWGTQLTEGDLVYSWGNSPPQIRATFNGFRIASAVPTPGTLILLAASCGLAVRRRRSS